MAAPAGLAVSFLFTLVLATAESAHAQIVPPLDPEAAGIAQCRNQYTAAPAEAANTAEKRLAAGGLTPFAEIGWLQCLGLSKAMMGQPRETAEVAQRIQQLVDAHLSEFNDTQQAAALAALGMMLRGSGDLPQATVVLQRVVEMTNADPLIQYRIAAAMTMGEIYGGQLNSPEAAEPWFHRAYELSQGHAFKQPMIDYEYAFCLLTLKRYDEARKLYEGLAQKLGNAPQDVGMRYRIDTQRAVILGAGERHEEALAMLESSLAGQRGIKDVNGEAYTLIQLANEQRSLGQRDAAIASARQAVELSHQGHFQQEEEDALRLLAKIHESAGESAPALDALRRADALTLATLDMRNRRERTLVDAALKRNGATESAASTQSPGWLIGLAGVASLSMLVAVFLWLRERAQRRALDAQDPLTALATRNAMIAHLAAAPALRRALLLVRVNKFDEINDLHGHDIGDRVLQQLAAQVRAACVPGELAARWSEDGFLAAIDASTPEEANARAEALRDAVERSEIDLADGDALRISVSIGVAPLPFFPQDSAPGDWHDSLRLSIRALQSARRAGASAWASIWGIEAQDNRSTLLITRSPVDAAASGQVRLDASSPLAWQN